MIIIHSEQFMNDKDIKQIEILKSFLKFCKCQSSKLWNDIFAEVRIKKKNLNTLQLLYQVTHHAKMLDSRLYP